MHELGAADSLHVSQQGFFSLIKNILGVWEVIVSPYMTAELLMGTKSFTREDEQSVDTSGGLPLHPGKVILPR